MGRWGKKLNWAIIGGGIHGTYFARRLRELSTRKIRILDANSTLLAQWKRQTKNCGQTRLRSPHVHNLGSYEEDLARYAAAKGKQRELAYLTGYTRPSLALFNGHVQTIIDAHKLQDLHTQAVVQKISPGRKSRRRGTFKLETDKGVVEAKHVVLALGQVGGTHWPDWALEYRGEGNVYHVFDPDFDLEAVIKAPRPVYVVGGGMTAAQLAVRLVKERYASANAQPVTLFSRHRLKVSELDAHENWTKTDHITYSLWYDEVEERERVVAEARKEGTIPRYVSNAVADARYHNSLEKKVDEIIDATEIDGALDLTFASGMEERFEGIVVLATGFNPPGGDGLIAQLSRDFDLPLSPSGYPDLDDDLEWECLHNYGRIYVTGELAALTLGPLAGNVRGAQMAAELILNGY